MSNYILPTTTAADLAQLQADVQALNTHAIQSFADKSGQVLLSPTGLQLHTTRTASVPWPGYDANNPLAYSNSWTNVLWGPLPSGGGPTSSFEILSPSNFDTEETLLLALGGWRCTSNGVGLPIYNGVDFASGVAFLSRAALMDSAGNLLAASTPQYQYCDSLDSLLDATAEIQMVFSLNALDDAGHTTTVINGDTWDVGTFYMQVQYQHTTLMSVSATELNTVYLDVLVLGGN